MSTIQCPVCGAAATGGHAVGDATVIVCPKCPAQSALSARKLMTTIRFTSLFVVFLVGCVSGTQRLGRIAPGMAPAQVDSIMGRRDAFQSVQHGESVYLLYRYINRFCNINTSADKCDFYVIFKDGLVVETGVRNIRTDKTDMHLIYLFSL
jgi:hypothetical protein